MRRAPRLLPGLVATLCAACGPSATAPPPGSPAGLPAASAAHLVVRAGDSGVDGGFLAPYENRWRISVTLPDGRRLEAGTWTDRLEAATAADGRAALRRTQRESERVIEELRPGFAAQIGADHLEITRVNVFDAKTLAPLETELATNIHRGSHARFDGPRIAIDKTIGDAPPIHVDERLDAAPFDYFGGMFGLLVAGLPLREGLTAKLAAFRPQQGDAHGHLEWVEARVIGRARVAAGPLGEREAWVVDVPGDERGSFRFWLSKEAPYVLRLEDTASAAGQTWDYDMF
jgi:hypothetical protein